MLVHPNQLVPGCLVTKDVIGKTNNPILPKNTVIKDIHMTILSKFLIQSVEVSPFLVDGFPFEPIQMASEQSISEIDSELEEHKKSLSFEEQYKAAVQSYKQQFKRWQSGAEIDISHVRRVIIPLLAKIEEVGLDLFLLHRFSTKEDYFYHHAVATSLISAFLARKRGITKDWIQIGIAGLLADSGMAKLNPHLLHKQDELSLPEYDEIKKHPTYSYRLVEDIPTLSTGVKLAILQHHERLDGSGYPLGVKKDKTHPYAFIIAISDTYHAMTSERLYKKKQSPFKVIEEMMQNQFLKFDHETIQTFVTCLTNFSIGNKVVLSNNMEAEIVFIEPTRPTRPMVRLIDSKEIIALKDHQKLYVKAVIK